MCSYIIVLQKPDVYRFSSGLLCIARVHCQAETYSEEAKKAGESYNKRFTIHHGRHSFCSHALAGGRSLAEVRDAAGHADISSTSVYTHVVSGDEEVGSLFDFADP